jgi:acyl-CoA thioesterase FadM
VHVADQGRGRRQVHVRPDPGRDAVERDDRRHCAAIIARPRQYHRVPPIPSTELPDPARIRIRHRVEWLDTDAAGIYHWTTVGRFAEAAEAALHNALGITDVTFGSTPRLSVAFEFPSPLRFNDEVTVDLVVEAVGRSTVRYRLVVRDRQDRIAATGTFTTCFVNASLDRSQPWPDHVRAALSAAGSQTTV